MKNAFTMIELVFIIVVLGILGAVAFPRLAPVLEDARIARGQSNVAAIRSAIANERNRNVLRGDTNYPQMLDDATANTDGQSLFDGNATVSILQYPLFSKATGGNWIKTSNNAGATIGYRYYLTSNESVDFTYTKANGRFDCNHTAAGSAGKNCKALTE